MVNLAPQTSSIYIALFGRCRKWHVESHCLDQIYLWNPLEEMIPPISECRKNKENINSSSYILPQIGDWPWPAIEYEETCGFFRCLAPNYVCCFIFVSSILGCSKTQEIQPSLFRWLASTHRRSTQPIEGRCPLVPLTRWVRRIKGSNQRVTPLYRSHDGSMGLVYIYLHLYTPWWK